MTISWQTPGTITYSGGSGYIDVAVPSGIVAGDKLLLLIGLKTTNYNDNPPQVAPSDAGWSLVVSNVYAGGYGGAYPGIDTGNTSLFVFERIVPAGGLGAQAGRAYIPAYPFWGIILRLSCTSGAWEDSTGAVAGDVTGGTAVSLAFSSDPGVQSGDLAVGAMCIPTDTATPNQFSSETFTQSGVTFGTVVEVVEPDSSLANDIGGFVCYAPVVAGSSSGAPTLTATASGTTTNVRGPGVFIRVREATPSEDKTAYCSLSASASAVARPVKGGVAHAQAVGSAALSGRGSKAGVASAALAGSAVAVLRGIKGASVRAALAAVATLFASWTKHEKASAIEIAARALSVVSTQAHRLPPVVAADGRAPSVAAITARRLPPVVAGATRVPGVVNITARMRKP